MAKPVTTRQTARVVQLRKGATVEMVRLTCPDSAQAIKIAESFGTAVIDSEGIRDLHERLITETADALSEGLGDRAMQIHLQRQHLRLGAPSLRATDSAAPLSTVAVLL